MEHSVTAHATVLLDEAVKPLVVNPHGIYVDGTFGRGGHSHAILKALSPQGRLIAFDRDVDAVKVGQAWTDPRFTIVHAAFSNLKARLIGMNVPQIDGLILDLGVSSPQLDEAARGFSFRFDAPLDMRMDTSPESPSMTAAQWLNSATQQQISQVIFEYGEERGAAKIAANIVLARQTKALQTTTELAQLVQATVKSRKPGQHPATRTFQAIRIHINQELKELETVLDQAQSVIRDAGRLSIISFHSLEDRLVKQRFRAQPVSVALRHLPRDEVLHPWLEIERIKPSEQECATNARSRSAVLRVAQRQAVRVVS